jgi:two-component system chemotaxis response regulator CheY
VTTTLIVDDELDMRTLVRFVIELDNHGLSVIGEAASGEEALDLWRSLNPPPIPDVVILDNRMPGLSGIEVARRILAEEPTQALILYSAYLTDEVMAEAESIGIRACVSKNDLKSLPDTIRRIVGET